MLQPLYFVWYFRRRVICPCGPTSGFQAFKSSAVFVKLGKILYSLLHVALQFSFCALPRMRRAVSRNLVRVRRVGSRMSTTLNPGKEIVFFWIVEQSRRKLFGSVWNGWKTIAQREARVSQISSLFSRVVRLIHKEAPVASWLGLTLRNIQCTHPPLLRDKLGFELLGFRLVRVLYRLVA